MNNHNDWLALAADTDPDSRLNQPHFTINHGVATNGYRLHIAPSNRPPFPIDATRQLVRDAAAAPRASIIIHADYLIDAIGPDPGVIMLTIPLLEDSGPLELFHPDGRYAAIIPHTTARPENFRRPFNIAPPRPATDNTSE
jgi:hypothetical protein